MISQKRMAFHNPVVPFPHTMLSPGSCQAVRIETLLSRPVERVAVTPEWRTENELKQVRYERDRAAWRREVDAVEVD